MLNWSLRPYSRAQCAYRAASSGSPAVARANENSRYSLLILGEHSRRTNQGRASHSKSQAAAEDRHSLLWQATPHTALNSCATSSRTA